MVSDERLNLLRELEEEIGYKFGDIALFNISLTHKSYANENGNHLEDNERLEFLGDAVLDLMIRDYTLRRYPKFTEGDLTRLRSSVASSRFLAKIARRLKLGRYLLLGKGEEASGGRRKVSLLANAFEAVVAAIFLDSDFERAYSVLIPILERDINSSALVERQEEHKSKLQELVQERMGVIPSYEVVRESGPDHRKTFEINLKVNGTVYGVGKGKSKKQAEQNAARMAYRKLTRRDEEP